MHVLPHPPFVPDRSCTASLPPSLPPALRNTVATRANATVKVLSSIISSRRHYNRFPWACASKRPVGSYVPTDACLQDPPFEPFLADDHNYRTELELQRVHDRLDRLEFGDTAASTPRGHAWRFSWDGARWGSEPSTPAPTPAIIAVGHTAIPLAETLPTAQDSPSRYSCTLVVPDSVVRHIVGRGGKGLHQSHDISEDPRQPTMMPAHQIPDFGVSYPDP
ncbi:hypothetical protein R3P38DRAFT_3268084 [Favolaschia claudopus]|uniref:K Homology domain-containing protein n=1 Tax=Favolaschia claudopus TaxID=2862362 RepID=A0AAW0BM66_9AGAR